MTFKEYLTNNGKTKVGLFEVDICKDDCNYAIVSQALFAGKEMTTIEFEIDVKGVHCKYKCYAHSGYSYTMDEHGNMKNPTVFTFIDSVLLLP